MTANRIEREIVVDASIDEAWRALTDPELVSRWFGTDTEIDLRPGGAAAFVWDGDRHEAVVETVEPPTRFAYRWSLASNVPFAHAPTSLVEFTLSEVAGGTRVRLVESGFASLADGAERRAENDEGWAQELGELAKLLGEVA